MGSDGGQIGSESYGASLPSQQWSNEGYSRPESYGGASLPSQQMGSGASGGQIGSGSQGGPLPPIRELFQQSELDQWFGKNNR